MSDKDYLKCDTCGQMVDEPFDDGDECVCGGYFRSIDWYYSQLSLLALWYRNGWNSKEFHFGFCPGGLIQFTIDIRFKRAMEGEK